MEQIVKNFRLRGTSGEYAGKWLLTIRLAAKIGIPRVALALEDADLHPENYVVSPTFTDEEDSASKIPSLETALRDQRRLKREGIETELV